MGARAAAPDPREEDTTENVRRLLRRDAKGFKDLDEMSERLGADLPEDAKAEPSASAPPAAAPAASPFAAAAASPSAGAPAAGTPPPAASPFAPQAGAGGAASPFAPGPGKAVSPFQQATPEAEVPEAEEPEPWYYFYKYISLTQVVIAVSFTLIIGLMVSTFFFVLNSGGISYNDQ